ncbi:MAG: DNA-3-methyladenine glycosylase I [Pirellulaceae bacterium]
MSQLINIDDRNIGRCWWCGSDPLYMRYHDREWGLPVRNDQKLYEKLCLEGFQAGLSWITILRKREAFREAFAGFEIQRVARFNQRDVNRLLKNEGIVRHRGKIEATINNARCAQEMQDQQGSLAGFLWQFEPKRQLKFNKKRATTPESTEMSRQLRKLDWKFVGPTTCYSFMQAMGLVNDHHPKCFRWEHIEQRRSSFKRPRR